MTLRNEMTGFGIFGNIAQQYDLGRIPCPQRAIELCMDVDYHHSLPIADLGCGTGISTFQLSNMPNLHGRKIIGIDVDSSMIGVAKTKQYGCDVEFIVSKASDLPMNRSVGLVTAFESFHWFREQADIVAIANYLSSKGTFVAVNRNEKDGIRNEFMAILEDMVGGKLQRVKPGYDPLDTLRKSKQFSHVEQVSYEFVESRTLEAYMNFLKASTHWKRLSEDAIAIAERRVKEAYAKKVDEKGMINGTIDVVVVRAIK